jgi:pyridoxamine 5'-phosphate oxidase family protein
MSIFTESELRYLLDERRLARLATVGKDGTPHLAPVVWCYKTLGTIDVSGRDFARTKKFRDVARTGRAALVIDDVLSPWQPRGVEIRGRAEAIDAPEPLIRIYPERVIGWGARRQHPRAERPKRGLIQRRIERLVDAYQAEALTLDELQMQSVAGCRA